MTRFVLGLLCLVLASCATDASYVITMKDGREISAKSWPSLQSGFYRSEDPSGQPIVVPENQVASIVTAPNLR